MAILRSRHFRFFSHCFFQGKTKTLQVWIFLPSLKSLLRERIFAIDRFEFYKGRNWVLKSRVPPPKNSVVRRVKRGETIALFRQYFPTYAAGIFREKVGKVFRYLGKNSNFIFPTCEHREKRFSLLARFREKNPVKYNYKLLTQLFRNLTTLRSEPCAYEITISSTFWYFVVSLETC